MNNVQRPTALAVVSLAVLLLVIGVMRALSPKEHYYEWAEPAGQAAAAEQLMSYMDTNRDGYITMDEAPEELQQWFTQIDQNADGGIDATEAQVMADGMNNQ